jgi:hypothetical protein
MDPEYIIGDSIEEEAMLEADNRSIMKRHLAAIKVLPK